MKRGCGEQAAERADRRVEALEVADLQDAPPCAPRARPAPRPPRRVAASGFSTSTSTPAASRSRADRVVVLRRHRDAGAVDRDRRARDGRRAPRRRARGDPRGARPASTSTTPTSSDAGERGVLLGVEAAEVADARRPPRAAASLRLRRRVQRGVGVPRDRRWPGTRAPGAAGLESATRRQLLRRRPSGNADGGGLVGGSYGAGARVRRVGGRTASHRRDRRIEAHGTHGRSARRARLSRIALLTEIGPADEPSTVRPAPSARKTHRWRRAREHARLTSSAVTGARRRGRPRGRSRSGALIASRPRRAGRPVRAMRCCDAPIDP